MYILPRVCAEFHDRKGSVIYRIGREDLLIFKEAPDAIQEDILFRMLVADGSIELAPKDAKEKAKLENEPMRGVDATGKKKKAEVETTEAETKTTQAETVAETKAAGKTDKAETKK